MSPLHLGHVDDLPREARRLAAVTHRAELYREALRAYAQIPTLAGVRNAVIERINQLDTIAARLERRITQEV